MDGTPARQDSSLSTRIASLARSIISWMVATVLVCICMTAVYFFQRADEELRRHVEHTLAQACTSFDVSVGSAHFVKGEGIRLRKLSIVQPTTPQQPNRTEVLFCDEVLLFCAPTMEQLLDRKVDIDRVRLRGLWLQPTRYANGKWNLENLFSAQNPDSKKIPTIVIEDAQVELIDRVPVQPKVSLWRHALPLIITSLVTGLVVWGLVQSETPAFVLAPAQTGRHAATRGRARRTHGHSLAVSPWGEVIADAGTDPGVTLVDLDLSVVETSRQRVPCPVAGTSTTGVAAPMSASEIRLPATSSKASTRFARASAARASCSVAPFTGSSSAARRAATGSSSD